MIGKELFLELQELESSSLALVEAVLSNKVSSHLLLSVRNLKLDELECLEEVVQADLSSSSEVHVCESRINSFVDQLHLSVKHHLQLVVIVLLTQLMLTCSSLALVTLVDGPIAAVNERTPVNLQ